MTFWTQFREFTKQFRLSWNKSIYSILSWKARGLRSALDGHFYPRYLLVAALFLAFLHNARVALADSNPVSSKSAGAANLTFNEAPALNVQPGEVFTHIFPFRNETTTTLKFRVQTKTSLSWAVLDMIPEVEIPPQSSALISVILQVPATEIAGVINETTVELLNTNGSVAESSIGRAQVQKKGQVRLYGMITKDNPNPDPTKPFVSSMEVKELASSFWVEVRNQSNKPYMGTVRIQNQGEAAVTLAQSGLVSINPGGNALIPVSIVFTPEKSSALFYLVMEENGESVSSPPYVVRYLDPLKGDNGHSKDKRMEGGLQISTRGIQIDNRWQLEQQYQLELDGPLSDYFQASLMIQGLLTPMNMGESGRSGVQAMYLHLQGSRTQIELGWPLNPRLFGVPTDGESIAGIRAMQVLNNVDVGLSLGRETDSGGIGVAAGAQYNFNKNHRLAVVVGHSSGYDLSQLGTRYQGNFKVGQNISIGPTLSFVISNKGQAKLWHRTLLTLKNSDRWPMMAYIENRMDTKADSHRVGMQVSHNGEKLSSFLDVGYGISKDKLDGSTVSEVDVTAIIGKPIFKDRGRASLQFQMTSIQGEAMSLNEIAVGPRISTNINGKLYLWAGAAVLARAESENHNSASGLGLRYDAGLAFESNNHSLALYVRGTEYLPQGSSAAQSSFNGGVRSETDVELRYRYKIFAVFGNPKLNGVASLFVQYRTQEVLSRRTDKVVAGAEISAKTGRVTWSLYATTTPEVGFRMTIPLSVPTESLTGALDYSNPDLTGYLHVGQEAIGSAGAVVGAVIVATDVKRGTRFQSVTSEMGVFRFMKIPPGEYKIELVSASVPAYLVWPSGTKTVTLARRQKLNLDIELKRTRALSVLVFHDANQNGLWEAGERVEPSVRVEVQDGSQKVLATGKTDHLGRIQFFRFPIEALTARVNTADLPAGAEFPNGGQYILPSEASFVLLPYTMSSSVGGTPDSVEVELDREILNPQNPVAVATLTSDAEIARIELLNTQELPEFDVRDISSGGKIQLRIQAKKLNEHRSFQIKVRVYFKDPNKKSTDIEIEVFT